mmetsp:Transcript_52860/g.153821  ORF Transcript_52860/g.153821 Transcript_52860/m.153821 type:complete len:438 (-) Transcript_52860:118-1431(-)
MDFGGGGMPAGLEGLLGGGGLAGLLGGALDKIWDMPMIQMIAFHPRPEQPSHLGATSGPIRDGAFSVGGGDTVSYRLYLPPESKEVQAVIYNFHGNAEVCTDVGIVVEQFLSLGAAVLSIDYRGFAWGSGQPKLTALCPDAEACWRASQQVLDAAGCGGAKRIAMGRSIGATCAVHLASKYAADVCGLIVDSGLMSIKGLPMVEMLAPQVLGPQAPAIFPSLKEPFDTYGKLAAVSCPTLVMHGERDEIVPVIQGAQCHERCASADKRLVRWPTATHNDVLAVAGSEWFKEISGLVAKALQFDNALPAGALVEAHSLSNPTFNGLQGRVIGPQGERIRVEFEQPHGEKALKPDNLKVIERRRPDSETAEGDIGGPPPFPLGSLVEAHSLASAPEFNGMQGKVVGMSGERVRVQFPDPHGEKKLKPANLKAADGEASA